MRAHTVASLIASWVPDQPVVCLRPAFLEGGARVFTSLFPGDVLYAVKCNPHPAVLGSLVRGGVRHFDTASLAEVRHIRELFGDSVVAYFHHPVKARSAIAEAAGQHGVKNFVVDHEAEIHKIRENAGTDQHVAVRIATPPGEAVQHMSTKFGAEAPEAVDLLRASHSLGFSTGLAFHVGSQCRDPEDYFRALRLAAEIRDAAGIEVSTVNVGGGFPTMYINDSVPPLSAYLTRIAEGVSAFDFGRSRLQCEPGRALVADGSSTLAQVHLRKDRSLYINDGIFGGLCELAHLNLRVPIRAHRLGSEVPGPPTLFTLYGPTCDPVDVLPNSWKLPAGIQEGDWIEIGQTGAYSSAITTRFNGFAIETFAEIEEPPFWLSRRTAVGELQIA